MNHGQGIRRVKRASLRVAGATAILGMTGWIVAGQATSAFADSTPYELFCPGTPVGSIALNGVVTTASITPASPASGGQFSVSNYQTTVNLPAAIVTAAQALGNTSIAGQAITTLDATGATPAQLKGQPISFNLAIPSTIPSTGLALTIPATPGTAGPFTASGGAITISQDAVASLTLTVSGNPLSLNCTAYANNSVPSGITANKPSGAQTSPQIATASAGGSAAPTTTAPAATPTTAPPATASTGSGSLAYTGTGPGVLLLGEMGLGALAAAALLTVGYRARAALASAYRGRRQGHGG
ncbi:MAG TPA: hypothetical protein VKR22_06480 [Acidimicrobiales bacterium]|nr:hypothetical protein [Acidimicrobiales bacterium]